MDDEYGLPLEEISCPSCGRTYKQQRTVCRNCQECKSCCKKHPCDAPNHVPARVVIEVDVLGWVSPLSDKGEPWSETVTEWMAAHPQEKRRCALCHELIEPDQPTVDDLHLDCSVKLADSDNIDRDHPSGD